MRMTALAAAIALVPGVALAGVLDLPGAYGNEAGCKYLKTNDYGDDSVIALTPDEYMTFATGCEFLQSLIAQDGSRVLTVLCSHEGEATRTIDFMRVVKAPDVGDSYDVYDAAGEHQATLSRCP